MINSITQVVLEVDDQDRARKFWTAVLGFELAKDETFGDERWVEVRPPEGGPLVVLAQRQPGRPRPDARPEHPSAPAMFGCRDLRATYRELAARGVRFAQTPVSRYFGGDGPTSYTATMEQVDGSWVWSMRSDQTRFAGIFSGDLTHITGHWERLADDGSWLPWMDIELAR